MRISLFFAYFIPFFGSKTLKISGVRGTSRSLERKGAKPAKGAGGGGVIDSLDFFSKVEASPCP